MVELPELNFFFPPTTLGSTRFFFFLVFRSGVLITANCHFREELSIQIEVLLFAGLTRHHLKGQGPSVSPGYSPFLHRKSDILFSSLFLFIVIFQRINSLVWVGGIASTPPHVSSRGGRPIYFICILFV